MTTPFTYSILQYRHSLVLGEAINVGILFQFPSEEKVEFVAGNAYRLKAIYPDFDHSIYNYLIKSIEKKLKEESSSLFRPFNNISDFKKYINGSILSEDASALQFLDPINVLGRKAISLENTIEEFSRLLLPGIVTKKPEIAKHNEQFLIKRYTSYIFEHHKELEKKLIKNKVIKTKLNNSNIELKFDLAWKNNTTNLVRPISFDLAEEKTIQEKSLLNYGYLNALKDYATTHNYRFDFIVSKPQSRELYKSYENALGLLELSDTPKRIVTERTLKEYSEETIEELLKH